MYRENKTNSKSTKKSVNVRITALIVIIIIMRLLITRWTIMRTREEVIKIIMTIVITKDGIKRWAKLKAGK